MRDLWDGLINFEENAPMVEGGRQVGAQVYAEGGGMPALENIAALQ